MNTVNDADSVMRMLHMHPEAVLYLGENATAWNPASTSHLITGPATVTYVLHPDGGVTVTVERRR